MSKSHEVRKETRKKPVKTLSQKRAEKRLKKVSKNIGTLTTEWLI